MTKDILILEKILDDLGREGVLYKNFFTPLSDIFFKDEVELSRYQELQAKIAADEIAIDSKNVNLKLEKSSAYAKLSTLYQQKYQIVKVKDAITFYLELWGANYDMITLNLSKGIKSEFQYLDFKAVDGARYFLKGDCLILINETYKRLDKVSTSNRNARIYYEEIIEKSSDIQTLKDLMFDEVNFEQIADLESELYKKKFIYNYHIDLDNLLEDLANKSNLDLLNLNYSQVDIERFMTWCENVQKNEDGKYIIFEKAV